MVEIGSTYTHTHIIWSAGKVVLEDVVYFLLVLIIRAFIRKKERLRIKDISI